MTVEIKSLTKRDTEIEIEEAEKLMLVPGIFFLLSDHLTEFSVVQFFISAGIELCEGKPHLIKQSFFTTALSLLLC